MIIKISPKIISLNKKFQNICKKPYHGHNKGCPNYGKREDCPPGLPLLNEVLDFEKQLYLIYTSFPIGKFAEKMRMNHPEWSKHPRQWYNPRRWQPTARKEHRLESEKFLKIYSNFYVENNPEAYGTNLASLMKNIGIELDWKWPPEHKIDNLTYRISIGGIIK